MVTWSALNLVSYKDGITIKNNNVSNYDAQKEAALATWCQNNGHCATVKAFIDLAEKNGNKLLHDDVREFVLQ